MTDWCANGQLTRNGDAWTGTILDRNEWHLEATVTRELPALRLRLSHSRWEVTTLMHKDGDVYRGEIHDRTFGIIPYIATLTRDMMLTLSLGETHEAYRLPGEDAMRRPDNSLDLGG